MTDKAVPKPGKDRHTDKANEKSRGKGDDKALKPKERSGPSREHNG